MQSLQRVLKEAGDLLEIETAMGFLLFPFQCGGGTWRRKDASSSVVQKSEAPSRTTYRFELFCHRRDTTEL